MSDETTLLPCPFCGGEAQTTLRNIGDSGEDFWSVECFDPECGCDFCLYHTEAEAIAAWNERAYLNPDGLPVGLTISDDGTLLDWRGENYVKQSTLGSCTLTAAQVREAIEEAKAELLESCEYVGDMRQRKGDVLKAFGKMEQAIADELNAELGRGMCKFEHVKSGPMYDVWRCSVCGYEYAESVSETSIVQNFCPSCGNAVKR